MKINTALFKLHYKCLREVEHYAIIITINNINTDNNNNLNLKNKNDQEATNLTHFCTVEACKIIITTDCNCICMQSFTELAFNVHSSRYYVGSMICITSLRFEVILSGNNDCCLSSLLTHERVVEKVLSLWSPPVHKCSSEHTCFWNRNKVFQPIRRQRQGPEPVTFQTGEGVGLENCSCYV